MVSLQYAPIPLDTTGPTLKVHKTVRRRPGHVLNALRTLRLRTVSSLIYSTNSLNHVVLSVQMHVQS